MFFLGCDSGSTKIAFCICDDKGHVLSARAFPGITIFREQAATYAQDMRQMAEVVLREAGIRSDELRMCAMGLTGCGETPDAQQLMESAVEGAFPGAPYRIVNDSVVGWSGALKASTGIHVVSGTGAIAYGEDGHGGKARCGGWTVYFNDEGSAYWIAVQGLNLFFQQADGRLPKTAFYDACMEYFHIRDPLHAPGVFEEMTDGGNLAKVAAFQKQVLELCRQGDPYAADIYRRAAHELFRMVRALHARLDFGTDTVRVSYSGGVFRGKGVLLDTFSDLCRQEGFLLTEPAFGPLAGSIGYAAREFVDRETLERMMQAVEQAPVLA